MTGFTNKQDWFTATAALAVWAAHFMLLWAASVIFPGQLAARWIAAVLTLVAGVALGWLWVRARRPSLLSVAGLGLGLGAAGVAFGFVPALIG